MALSKAMGPFARSGRAVSRLNSLATCERAKSASAYKSWVPTKGEKVHEAVQSSMIYALSKSSIDVAERIVPWYLSQLPEAYFREVGESTRMEHLRALAALKDISQAQDMSLTLRSRDEDHNCSVLTVLHTDNRPGAMYTMLSNMKSTTESDGQLRSVRSYTAKDNTLTVNVFTYGDDHQQTNLEDAQAHLEHAGTPEARASMKEYLSNCHPRYVQYCNPARLKRHNDLYDAVKGSDRCEVRIHSHKAENTHELTITTQSNRPERLLTKIVGVLPMRGINIISCRMDIIKDPSNPVGDEPGSVCVIRILVKPAEEASSLEGARNWEGDFNDLNSPAWKELTHSLGRMKWLDMTTIDLAMKHLPELGMHRAEVLTALVAMLHGPLSKISPIAYSRPNLHATIKNPLYTHYFTEIVDLFLARFDPTNPLSNEEFAARSQALETRLRGLINETARVPMLKMLDAVKLTLRTNFFMPSRYALAFRLDPSLMIKEGQLMPFGALFIHGQGFDGFHNRFQNIARGGLRLVTPNSAEQYAMESSRVYDEVYGLSYAQQLKNKDIPEGGSKAVCLVNVDNVSARERHRVLRNSVRAFTDSMLDLIVNTEETEAYRVDHLGFEELIYLGPDEQVIPEDINWIIQQAGRRGYPIPAAFMSSKPLAGINHKDYGVTSEGVAVFLDVALRTNGIDPNKEEFSIKITGGPDGDVAGNLMRILFREYGENAKIVGIADGSGCAEDPNGLSHADLMRLFEAGLPIGDLEVSTLSPSGSLNIADNEEGIRIRNSMVDRVKSDVFVPAGGRPNTIHAGNWENFIDPTSGMPSSPLIVEGANIFITPEARTALFEKAGVLIVKDSSANKCGVITSSYEICASMLIDEKEFLDIKEELVEDVLCKLRELARMEAELLLREYRNYPGALPEFSERISQAINRAKSAVTEELKDMERGDSTYQELMPLFHDHLPRKLTEVASHRVDERIPVDYLRNAFASCLASKLLYKEGTHFVESQPTDRLGQLALDYYRQGQRVKHLLENVAGADLPEGEKLEVLELLKRGGTRSALMM